MSRVRESAGRGDFDNNTQILSASDGARYNSVKAGTAWDPRGDMDDDESVDNNDDWLFNAAAGYWNKGTAPTVAQAFSDVYNPFGFQGRVHLPFNTDWNYQESELMLVDHRRRINDPVTGRWMTRDPSYYANADVSSCKSRIEGLTSFARPVKRKGGNLAKNATNLFLFNYANPNSYSDANGCEPLSGVTIDSGCPDWVKPTVIETCDRIPLLRAELLRREIEMMRDGCVIDDQVRLWWLSNELAIFDNLCHKEEWKLKISCDDSYPCTWPGGYNAFTWPWSSLNDCSITLCTKNAPQGHDWHETLCHEMSHCAGSWGHGPGPVGINAYGVGALCGVCYDAILSGRCCSRRSGCSGESDEDYRPNDCCGSCSGVGPITLP